MEIVKILSSVLELSGYEVDEAYNGVEAVEHLKGSAYDVVITDAEMPGMGGVDVCKVLKSLHPDTYVIGMSGSFRSLKELKDAGADTCIAKPFNIGKIEEIIENRLPPSSITVLGPRAPYYGNDYL
jgi:CheY-like chemotaxis protein